ncbi:MAG: bifunctional demethylmenaquinone methyltransferase/2-methoxy-6-polyprenyl-1,4-benzoquinol methylase UbiE [Bacteroidales bacterium]
MKQKEQVRTMFNDIAPKYDFLNHFLSAGIDRLWRKKAVRILKKNSPKTVLDLATGTADLAIEVHKIRPEKITGIDIAEEMLAIGRDKIAARKLDHIITLETGDAENLHFPDHSFDAVMVAFGVRNFENLEKGLREMHRVISPKGMVLVLEFSKPVKFPVKQLYNFYFKNILPGLGRLISGNSSAYTYLPDSVGKFPSGEEFLRILETAGFTDTRHHSLTFGIAAIYTGIKSG